MSIELAWILLAGTGLAVSLRGLWDAHEGTRAMRNRYNGRRIVARGYRRSEALTALKQLVLIAIGIPAVLNPEPVRLSPFVLALFALNLLGLARTTLEWRDRVVLRRMLDRYAESER